MLLLSLSPRFHFPGWLVVRQVLSVLLLVAATLVLQLSILYSAWEATKKRWMGVANLALGALMVAELAWLFLSSSIDYLLVIVFIPMVLLYVCWVVIAVGFRGQGWPVTSTLDQRPKRD